MKKRKIFIIISAVSLLVSCSNNSDNPNFSNDASFTVTWKNYDGTVLEIDTNVEKGSMPSYDGKTPVREQDQQYKYEFDKWSPELSKVTSDATYVATFNATMFASKIIFDLDGGTTNSSTNSIYVTSIRAADFFFDVSKENYNFRGWSYNGKKVFDHKGNMLFNPNMAEDMIFKAVYAQDTYLTIISNINGAATITGEGLYAYNSYVDVRVITNRGYIFIGWYDYASGTLLSNQETYKYMMWSDDVTLEARFRYDKYLLKIESAHPLLGSVMIKDDLSYMSSSSKTFDYLSSVTISAYNKTEEYRFLGWFNESGSLVETNAVYTFLMPYNDYRLFARWDAPNFNVNVTKNREHAGTVTGGGPHAYNSSVTIGITTNIGYSFDGIYSNSNKITSSNSYTFSMPFESVDLLIKWNIINYTITYQLNGGTNNPSNPSSYTVEDSVTFSNPTKTGYTFTGWTCDGSSITSISAGSTGSLVLTANWSVNTYEVSLNANGGICSDTSLNIVFGSAYELPTPTRLGYTFNGWYNGSTSINQSGIWNYDSNLSLVAHWSAINYTITYQLNGGTNNPSNPSSYTIEDGVTFSNPTKTGYTFLGWFDNNDNQIIQITVGTTGALTLTAHWNEGNEYTVTLDANGGQISEASINAQYDHGYSLPTPTRLGYTFNGWYDGSTKVNNSGTWKYTTNKTFVAHWTIITYSISYTLNGGTNNPSNPSSYTVEDGVTFSNPTKTGYTFFGWFTSDTSTTGIPAGSTGNVGVEARWSANQYVLSVTSEDTSKGTVAITSGSGYSDESITVVATTVDDCVFKGWYHDDTKVSDDATYTFIMPTNDYSLVAHFFTKAEEEAIRYGTRPILSEDGKTLTYGLYPQTNVNDSTLVSSLNTLTTPESNGWYLYNNEYYAKVSANPFKIGYKFDNGTTIVSGTTYWFKCEPIVWNVLSNNNGEYYILSSVLLDAHCYYNSTSNRTIDGKTIYPNNYEYSDIRTWLNNDFYNSAFALGNSHIQTTTVDNSASTTNSSDNSCACNNTQDKVFLPSYKDYINSSYGFSTSTSLTDTRYCRTTDWARARGAYYYTSSGDFQYNGYYWTRSPNSNSDYSKAAWDVNYYGDLYSFDFVYHTNGSVRPGLSITIA